MGSAVFGSHIYELTFAVIYSCNQVKKTVILPQIVYIAKPISNSLRVSFDWFAALINAIDQT